MFQGRRWVVARVSVLVAVGAVAVGPGPAGAASVQLRLPAPVIDLYHAASVTVSGVHARRAEVRLLGALDRRGPAYRWTPYPWRPLRLVGGSWHGLLPAPPLLGVYQLQLRLDHGRALLSSPRWLLHVLAAGTMTRRSFPTARAAIRDFVAHLPGRPQLVALRPWPRPPFDHRDPRLQRLFVIAYTPRGEHRPAARRGLFLTTVRDNYHGRWRLLQATTQPYD
jgi:hypothetical protein